ncbi:hypothetical protein HNP84_009824 [Thermocatellispora tengchongensis]|uniref:Uncharacterized protein n=1 Tax=Thermocatellispora tengchongensis TaxID=1073253 RepID=A0A840PM85_9ACTN|nr:hypothetical protein [Thermocatellispora tengchongensis]MBB5140059.1 hypothetical protein [Thermocatellispora tengchongensis]
MSYDLAVLGMSGPADVEAARRMFDRCGSAHHAEGELDQRIVAFYEELRAHFPDDPPSDDSESPWMSMPLSVGIDHVIMHLSYSERSRPALEKIMELAALHGLVVYDPQFEEVFVPEGDT